VIHNMENKDIDLSDNGEDWYHALGECFDNLPRAAISIKHNSTLRDSAGLNAGQH
jgi:hypothetical protein